MNNKDNLDSNLKELEIPEFRSLQTRLNCKSCPNRSNCDYQRKKSRYECIRFYSKFSGIKFSALASALIASTIYNLVFFISLIQTIIAIVCTFTTILLIDIFSDIILKNLLKNIEKNRRLKYDNEVEKIKEQNERIRKEKLGITDEFQDFIDYSKSLYAELSEIFSNLKESFNLYSKSEERIIIKSENILEELLKLNNKLSMFNYEDTSISPLYKLYLKKLLAYSNQTLELSKKGNLTEEQKVRFANLLEVFRKKLSDENTYLDNKTEDDFLAKIEALNKEVIPEYDGGESE